VEVFGILEDDQYRKGKDKRQKVERRGFSMTEQEKTMTKHEEGREIAEAIAIIKKYSDKPDIERVFMLGFFRGIDFKAEAEAITSGSRTTA
jgi:hypothetical protein